MMSRGILASIVRLFKKGLGVRSKSENENGEKSKEKLDPMSKWKRLECQKSI